MSTIGLLVYKLQLFKRSYFCQFSKQYKNLNLVCWYSIAFWLDKYYLILLRRKQWLRSGTLTLNAVLQTQMQMMLNAQVDQIRQLSPKKSKSSTNSFWPIKNWSYIRGVEDIRRQCIHHFKWTFVNEKAVLKVGAVFAHSWSKTTACRWFRVLFATLSIQQKRFFV